MPFRVSYWVLPVISGCIWLATLLGLWLHWIIDTDQGRFPSMASDSTIPYISNVGAHYLKPLFITGCVLTTIFFDLSFAADRWLRHRRRLAPNTSTGEKVLKSLTILFALVGTAGLVLLSIFDTWRHHTAHFIFLGFFIGGYVISAVFVCWEYRLLRINYREYPILRTSYLIKFAFIVIEAILCVAFAVLAGTRNYNGAAISEWIIALIFSLYIFSFTIDLWPAVHTKEVVLAEGVRSRSGGTRIKVFGWMSRRRGPAGPMEMEEAARRQDPERWGDPERQGTARSFHQDPNRAGTVRSFA